MTIRNQPLAAFCAAIASDAPAPGAGAAAGAALALGLACVRKAVAVTLKHSPGAIAEDVSLRLASLADQALAGAEADARCFAAYIDAVKAQRPHQDALEALVAVGENMVALCDEAQAAVAGVAHRITATMANDIAAARALITAARSIHLACLAESRHPNK